MENPIILIAGGIILGLLIGYIGAKVLEKNNASKLIKGAKKSAAAIIKEANIEASKIAGIGISYQMHGLVVVDKKGTPLRDSIIWCDSRAVEIGDEAFEAIGKEKCMSHLLNSPGNFTASKLKWVKDNEPELYQKIHKVPEHQQLILRQ